MQDLSPHRKADAPAEADIGPRPPQAGERLRRGASSLMLGHPWFDRAALSLLRTTFFPASRLWAAAHLAEGRVTDFAADVAPGYHPPPVERAARALARFEAARATATALDAAWDHVMFGPHDFPLAYREATEMARLAHRHAFNATRRHFVRLIDRSVPPVRLGVASPVEVAAAYAPALDDLAPFVAPPDPWPTVDVSRSVPGRAGIDTWIRFPSPSARLGDMVTARVYTPAGVADPPTVIFGHGVCVEFDHWQGLVDEVDELVRGGVRVIRPEAPWHGRRSPDGYFGGERLISTFPLGLLDAMTGAVREWSVLARWARQTSAGPIGFGGTSLGALTAQLAADRARDWPAELRPAALLLITHCGHLRDTVVDGALTQLWGGPEVAAARGWTVEQLIPYLALLDPRRRPATPPSRIISVLGRRDVVTPYAGGLAVVEDWCVPADNLFLLDRGHFSVPMTLLGHRAPVRRFIEALSGAR